MEKRLARDVIGQGEYAANTDEDKMAGMALGLIRRAVRQQQ